ncbi:hypothetical protein APHAL10511_000835 [Amanita phalloides]|nr:hypothetical protein APHAL10511_000835 [Amanita phalloides]
MYISTTDIDHFQLEISCLNSPQPRVGLDLGIQMRRMKSNPFLPEMASLDHDQSNESNMALDGQHDDVVIAMIGNAHSSVVRLLLSDTGVNDQDALESETSSVHVVSVHESASDHKVTVVDGPRFDDSRTGVTNISVLLDFLRETYGKDHRILNGCASIQRISDVSLDGQSGHVPRMFRKVCSTKAGMILTDQLASEQEGKRREEQLKAGYFKDPPGGAHVVRYDQAARDILHILTLVLMNVFISSLWFLLPGLCLFVQQTHGGASSIPSIHARPVYREEVDRVIGEYNKDTTELKDKIETLKAALKCESARWETERAELKKAAFQQKFIGWEDEKVQVGRDLSKAEENQKRFEVDGVNPEKWHRDHERELKSCFDDQEKRAHEKNDAIAKSEEQTTKLKSELETMKWGNSALSPELKEERARFQRESARWEAERVMLKKSLSEAEQVRKRLEADPLAERAHREKRHQDQERKWQSRFDDQAGWAGERAEPKNCLDEARKVQMRVEAGGANEIARREKLHREEVEQIIATYEEEMVALEFGHGMMKRHNDALQHEYEEEWARSQLRLVRWADERAELKKCLDEARKVQVRVGEDVAKEMAQREKLHREEMEHIIATYEEEIVVLEFEHRMMKRHNDALRHEYEEEWAKSQLALARSEALEAQRKAEADAAKERERYQKFDRNQA